MEIKKILWPTDLSNHAQEALPFVTSLTSRYQAEVHILYVIEELGEHAAWYGEFDNPHIEKIHEWEKEKAEERLGEICEKYLVGCPRFIRHVAIGDPADEILKLIQEEEVDIVVMATRGERNRFHFGSVTDRVVKYSPVKVVTVPSWKP